MNNNLGYSLAVEAVMGVEIPPLIEAIRSYHIVETSSHIPRVHLEEPA